MVTVRVQRKRRGQRIELALVRRPQKLVCLQIKRRAKAEGVRPSLREMGDNGHEIWSVDVLAVRVLIGNRAFRKLVQHGALTIFRCISLQVEWQFEVRGSEVQAREKSVSDVLVSFLLRLAPFENGLLSPQ